jgi:Transposase IS66 family
MIIKPINLPIIQSNEHTPLVDRLLEIIEEQQGQLETLKQEVDRLKGHKSKPNIKPSSLEKGSKKRKRGQRHKRVLSGALPNTTRTEIMRVENIPSNARFKGYRTYRIQELTINVENILYQLERWQLPDGGYVVAKLPPGVSGKHFGPTLQAYVLHQYHHQGVTQPLLHSQLRDWGIKISSGELNHLLVEDKESYHREKEAVLEAGLSVSPYIHVDDTGARHAGRNGYCTHIGNELFAWFESTGSKSRINFLKLLRQGYEDYVFTEASFAYMERQHLSPTVRKKLKKGAYYFNNEKDFEIYLKAQFFENERHSRIITEAGLIGSILHHGFSLDTVIMSDDAGQFNVFRHALCWIHAERNINKLIPSNDMQLQAVESVRSQLWNIYDDLKAYKEQPKLSTKKHIEKAFDNLCGQRTCYQLLNLQLKRMKANKSELLLVLQRPDIPLHNNLSERDIREYVKRRKVSGSTRSDDGRRCRDTFASLKKTAIKLKISFWGYLIDRITNQLKVPWLPNLLIQTATANKAFAPTF